MAEIRVFTTAKAVFETLRPQAVESWRHPWATPISFWRNSDLNGCTTGECLMLHFEDGREIQIAKQGEGESEDWDITAREKPFDGRMVQTFVNKKGRIILKHMIDRAGNHFGELDAKGADLDNVEKVLLEAAKSAPLRQTEFLEKLKK